jgi:hypothetical protein
VEQWVYKGVRSVTAVRIARVRVMGDSPSTSDPCCCAAGDIICVIAILPQTGPMRFLDV